LPQRCTTLAKLDSRYGEKIRRIFRDFPIESLHPGATKAHEAARCAGEQGKFWLYHDRLFANPRSSGPEFLKGLAKEVGLDTATFEVCLNMEGIRPRSKMISTKETALV
jgi:protein-disulfide isomerase